MGASLTTIISDLLFNTISYHDYAESFYHAFLAGLMSKDRYKIESNYENGLGCLLYTSKQPDLRSRGRFPADAKRHQ